jgi:uncharacterized protein YegL
VQEYIRQDARPLPVILLLDVSGSMSGSKIDALNQAVREMIASFKQAASPKAEIHLAVITFGGNARLHLDLTPADSVAWTPMIANGGTPLGAALTIAKELVEDKNRIPSRAYRPAIILVSDGQPTDNWEKPMDAFTREGRSAKCDRWSLAIGSDADERMLRSFLDHPEKRVFHAEYAAAIHNFFQFITITTTGRTNSQDPNVVPPEVRMADPNHDESYHDGDFKF